MPEGAVAFSGALMKTGYMFPLIMGTQLLVGVLLLLNRFVPLALVLIMPVLVNHHRIPRFPAIGGHRSWRIPSRA